MGSNHKKKTGGNMRSKQFLKTALILAIVFSIMILHTGMSSAKSMTLKVSHQFAAGDVRDQMGRVFDYPAQSLIKSREQWDAMRKGALDLSTFPLDYASGKVPQLSITLMPCSVTNIKQGLSWRNKPIGQKVNAIMEQNGVRNLVWAWFDGGLGSKIRQIKVPADVKGTKLRAAGKKFEFMLKEAGASITSMPSSETYHALSTGVLDTC
jgi:TRAP-type C4-dicarboxylate transport system substrate-binding protein